MTKSKHHISVCRLIPERVETYESEITLRLNDNESHDEVMQSNTEGKNLIITILLHKDPLHP